MITVELKPEELKHPANEKGHLCWWGRNAKFWDFDFIENASKEQLDLLEDALDEFVDLVTVELFPRFKEMITDYYLVGSYAMGYHQVFSDMDFQFTVKTMKEKKELYGTIDKQRFVKMVWDLGKRLKIPVEVNFGVDTVPEHHFSIKKRKLYGREKEVSMSTNIAYHREGEVYKLHYTRRNRKWQSIYWDDDGGYL